MDITEQDEATPLPQLELDSKQLEAITSCCDIAQRVVAVTGQAGTGKTTILEQVYKKLTEAGYAVVLCSPTGKAAKRITEVTGIEAQTIHRLLEYTHPGDPDPKTGKTIRFSFPRRVRANPIDYDVVLVDEYSMVNWEVHRALFDALPNAACVRVFGDANQLDPIEEDFKLKSEPTPFQTILRNSKFKAIILDTVHRQGADSGILLNLVSILRGRMPTKNDQWTMQFTDYPVDALREYVLQSLDNGVDFSTIDNQILTPQNTSWVGTVKLNAMLQLQFRDLDKQVIKVPRHDWTKKGARQEDAKGQLFLPMSVGDKVICTRNMYDLFVFNGETGVIKEITSDEEIIIDFGDREQAIPPLLAVLNRFGKVVEIDPRKDIDLAYAITTHKAQGSEYRRVVYVLNKSTAFMQNRRNLYTACSRGKEHVHIITDQRGLQGSIYKAG